ncbi:hypothetical protein Aperf_G00000002991 [Anoplocephala perfoliata]
MASSNASKDNSFYSFEALDINGNKVSMEKYRGKVVLVVNVASNCGLTNKNYPQLQELYNRYSSKGFCILGFPCNQFAKQERGSESEIKENVCSRFKVTFDLFSKVDVNGSDALPLFTYLKNTLHGTMGNAIKWNFIKFLIDRNGIPQKALFSHH